MHHVFRDIAAGKFPEQTPVDELVRIEGTLGATIQECAPIHVLRRAIGGNGSHPLPFSMWSVAAHPGLNLRDLSEQPIPNPLLCVRQRAGAFVLQADLNYAI